MDQMGRSLSRFLRCVIAAVFLLLPLSSYAVTTGKISGTVTDKETGAPLPAAAVRVGGTSLGALANEKGQYFVLNVQPGTYTIQVNVIGYVPLHVQNLTVNVDLTTFQDFEMESTVLEVTDPLVVLAERTMVDVNLTDSRTLIESAEIVNQPNRDRPVDILMTTAGSFGGNLRGGRPQDQQTTLDGAIITSPIENVGQSMSVNPYMIQELEVRTGTYNVEHPGALSGIVSVTTREGGERFSGNLQYRTLGQKGLNHMPPRPIDLADAFRVGIQDEDGLRGLIQAAITATNNFNDEPARLDDGLYLRNPFDVLDTTSTDPGQWIARYSRTNVYWDYDRINPEENTELGNVWNPIHHFNYLKDALPAVLRNSRSVDRSFHPDKYNAYQRHNRTEKRPTQLDWGMGGPLGRKISWFTSGRFAEDWGRMPNEYHRTMNAFGKMSLRPSSTTKLSVSGLIEDSGFFSKKGQRDTPYLWRYIPEGLNQRFDGRLHANVQFTHTLDARTFYEIRFSHLREYNEIYNPKYGKGPVPAYDDDANITAIGYSPTENGTFIWWGDQAYAGQSSLTNAGNTGPRDRETGIYSSLRPLTNDLQFNITSQVTPNHQFKAGTGLTLYDYHDSRRWLQVFGDGFFDSYGVFGETNSSTTTTVAEQVGWETHVYPYELGLFAQDRIEYGNLVANVGLRLDAFNPNANAIDPFRPRLGPNISDDNPQFRTKTPSVKWAISPRLGLSHPVTDRAALHYSYGVFNQRAPLNQLYDGLVSHLGHAGPGNPDLPYQRSTNYEMGVQGEPYPGYYLDVTGYFRDVATLPVEFAINSDPGFRGGGPSFRKFLLARNGQDARGLEISARKRMSHRFSFRANYTLSFSSDLTAVNDVFSEGLQIVDEFDLENPQSAVYRQQPTLFDRRHRLVTNLVVILPLGITASMLTMAQSGNEFRSTSDVATDPLGLLGNSRQAPWTTTTDLYLFKNFELGLGRVGLFTEIRNLFNRRNIYNIGSGEAGERYSVLGDSSASGKNRVSGAPLSGIGSLPAAPRDIFVGLNMSW
jgi:hypothetical protein